MQLGLVFPGQSPQRGKSDLGQLDIWNEDEDDVEDCDEDLDVVEDDGEDLDADEDEDEDVKQPWGVQQFLPNAFWFETPRAVPSRLIDLCKYDYHMDVDVENYDENDYDIIK